MGRGANGFNRKGALIRGNSSSTGFRAAAEDFFAKRENRHTGLIFNEVLARYKHDGLILEKIRKAREAKQRLGRELSQLDEIELVTSALTESASKKQTGPGAADLIKPINAQYADVWAVVSWIVHNKHLGGF